MTTGPDNNNSIISLGNPFFEEKGKIIGHRILMVVPETKVEYTILLNGIMNESVNITDIGTLVSNPIGDGMFYSQGQVSHGGVITKIVEKTFNNSNSLNQLNLSHLVK